MLTPLFMAGNMVARSRKDKMSKSCAYSGCDKNAIHYMCWQKDGLGPVEGLRCGFVCGQHNRELGRKNLALYGYSPTEILSIEREIRETRERKVA